MAKRNPVNPTRPTITAPQAVAAVDSGLLSPAAAAAAAGVAPRTLRGIRQRARLQPELAARVATEADRLREAREAAAGQVLGAALAALDTLTATAANASWDNGAAGQVVRLLQTWQTLTGQASSITEERRVTLDLTAAASQAIRQYLEAGYTEAEALDCLEQDDHELWRAYQAGPTGPAGPDRP